MESLVPMKSFQAIFLNKYVHQNRQGKLLGNIFPQIIVTNAILVTKTNCLQMQNVIFHTPFDLSFDYRTIYSAMTLSAKQCDKIALIQHVIIYSPKKESMMVRPFRF